MTLFNYRKVGGLRFITIGSLNISWSFKKKRPQITHYDLALLINEKAWMLYWIDTGLDIGNADTPTHLRYIDRAKRFYKGKYELVEDKQVTAWLKARGINA